MSDKDCRRISVYDLTGLRLHPNGYRVHQTTDNLNLGKFRQNVLTSRGWIADDAGGSISMPKFRDGVRLPSVTGEAEAFDVLGAVSNDKDPAIGDKDSGSGKRKGDKKYNNMRPAKRRRFFEDDSYILGDSRMNESSSIELEIPSQDLLKNIHYLAAQFYNNRGLLENTSKRYRDTRRAQERQQTRSHSEPTPETSQSSFSPDQIDTAQVAPQDQSTQLRRVSRDMYRVLDGSALLAIGMLTQETVKSLISSKKRSSPQPSDHEDDPGEDEYIEVMIPPSDSVEENDFTDDNVVSDGSEEEMDGIEDESTSQE